MDIQKWDIVEFDLRGERYRCRVGYIETTRYAGFGNREQIYVGMYVEQSEILPGLEEHGSHSNPGNIEDTA